MNSQSAYPDHTVGGSVNSLPDISGLGGDLPSFHHLHVNYWRLLVVVFPDSCSRFCGLTRSHPVDLVQTQATPGH